MNLHIMNTVEVIEVMEDFIVRNRPPEEIRNKVDLAYKIGNQSIIVFEIRPRWDKPEVKMESVIAKTTFVKISGVWKIFWLRSDLKWHSYTPKATVKSVMEFVDVIEEDKHHCFWG